MASSIQQSKFQLAFLKTKLNAIIYMLCLINVELYKVTLHADEDLTKKERAFNNIDSCQ